MSSYFLSRFFNKLFIMFPRILLSLRLFKHFRKRHPTNQTVSFRWKSVPLGSMEDLSLSAFCRALESHFFDWDKRFTDKDNNKYTPKTCVETRFFLYELLDRSLSYPGTVNLIHYLVEELDVREKIAELRSVAWEANGGNSEYGRELYYLDLDLSVFFPLKEDLKHFLYLLDISLMEEVRFADEIEQMRFNLIQFLYPYQSYLSYFLPFVKTHYWTIYPFQHYYLFFVFSLVSLLSHFLFYSCDLGYMFFFFYFFIIADFILELDHIDNLFLHLLLNISIFFFGFLGYFLVFFMMLFSWCVFFNRVYFYRPMEYDLPIYFD
ncbi:MAG: hypothetical protein K2X39_05700 [Silvanigrellaceae bacterium]|nr:hypothetical protein [Silvanigrellaceae bacterium]